MAVEKRLMHYASFDTQSSEESTSAPSTEKQLVLARELKAECEKIGFDSVELTDTGIVYAYLNANTDKKMDRSNRKTDNRFLQPLLYQVYLSLY